MSALTVAAGLTLGPEAGGRERPRPRWSDLQGGGRGLALRAEAWLRQNVSEPPTIPSLCAALGTSERWLHEAFREHLDATPKAYLKVLRLKAARRALVQGAEGMRVTDVALDYGFLHFGWFSQDYRRRFGETPRQTLRRAHTRKRAGGGAWRLARGRGRTGVGEGGPALWGRPRPPLGFDRAAEGEIMREVTEAAAETAVASRSRPGSPFLGGLR